VETGSSTASRFADRYGPWALVAGASEGLGREYALQLAARGLSLVMVARDAARLENAASEVRAKGVEVRTAALDLGSEAMLRELGPSLEGIEIGLLVYNAGLSTQQNFFDADLDDHLQKLYVNCRGPVVLAHHLGRAMSARRRGGIILMSSVAGFVGNGLNALYAATKAFDTVLGEGLARDLERRGVDVLAMVAGATRTPHFERSQTGSRRGVPLMEPAEVVDEALRSLGRTSLRVAGRNKLAAILLTRLLSRSRASRLLTRASHAVAGVARRD